MTRYGLEYERTIDFAQQVAAMPHLRIAGPAEMLDPSRVVVLPPGAGASDPLWQRLAPAVGAALGRSA